MARPRLGLGLGDPRSENGFNDANMRFARQLGCTDVILEVPYDLSDAPNPDSVLDGSAGFWSEGDLARAQARARAHGLSIYAIENFRHDHWHKILLDLPGKEAQMEMIKTTIRNMGAAGIPCMGYCFAITGVYGHARTEARGGAESVGVFEGSVPLPRGGVEAWNLDGDSRVQDDPRTNDGQTLRRPNGSLGPPLPAGEVWDTVVDGAAHSSGALTTATHEQMWSRLHFFLTELVPVAEEAGVILAAHPDDPPLPMLRGTAKLITHPDRYAQLLELVPSPSNACEFCQGTVSEMLEGDEFVYDAIRRYAPKNIAYVHFRNVVGQAPNYNEVFIDEGKVDMRKAMVAYRDAGYGGVMIPDHTPSMDCGAPWHAGMAFAAGYMKATATAVGYEFQSVEERSKL